MTWVINPNWEICSDYKDGLCFHSQPYGVACHRDYPDCPHGRGTENPDSKGEVGA